MARASSNKSLGGRLLASVDVVGLAGIVAGSFYLGMNHGNGNYLMDSETIQAGVVAASVPIGGLLGAMSGYKIAKKKGYAYMPSNKNVTSKMKYAAIGSGVGALISTSLAGVGYGIGYAAAKLF